MLLNAALQEVRSAHQSRLKSVLHGDDGSHQAYDRFAASDVTLQKPVHDGILFHVFHDSRITRF